MMKMWGLILVFYNRVGGETSNLVCTSSIDIKNCIYKNQDRISELKERHEEVKQLAFALQNDFEFNNRAIKNFNHTVALFQSKYATQIDLQNTKEEVELKMTSSGKRFHHLQEKVLANAETLSDLNENFEYVQQEIAKFESSLKAQSHSFNEKLSSESFF